MKILILICSLMTSLAHASKIETAGTKSVEGVLTLSVHETQVPNDPELPLYHFVKSLKTKKYEDADGLFTFACSINSENPEILETHCDITLKQEKNGASQGSLSNNYGTVHLYWVTAYAFYKFFGKQPGFGAIDINIADRFYIWGANSLIRIVVR